MRHNRHGISLVELLFTMTACAVILTMSAALIHRVMHVQTRARAFLNVERNALRLAQSFRHDVRTASSVVSARDKLGDGVLLRLGQANEQTIEYRQTSGNVERVVLNGDKVIAREDFSFPATSTFTIQHTGERALILSAQAASRDEPLTPDSVRVPFHIEAQLPIAAGGAS